MLKEGTILQQNRYRIERVLGVGGAWGCLPSVALIEKSFSSLGPGARLLCSHDAHKGLSYAKFGSTETHSRDFGVPNLNSESISSNKIVTNCSNSHYRTSNIALYPLDTGIDTLRPRLSSQVRIQGIG